MSENQQSRFEKSLGLLTTRFVSLLQKAKDGVLDLKLAADILAVRQKRRIYDITNVLEGIGLIEKKSKNSIQWKGAGPGCNTQEIGEKLSHLKRELTKLEEHEQMLDKHKQWIQQSIANIADDIDNSKFLYVTDNDLVSTYKDLRTLPIKAPAGTSLEMLNNASITNGFYTMRLKSTDGPISVYLTNPNFSDIPTQNLITIETDETKKQSKVNVKQPVDQIMDTEDEEDPELLEAQIVFSNIPAAGSSGGVESSLLDDLVMQQNRGFGSFTRLSPVPETNYLYSLCESEGVCDLFDIPVVNR